MNNAGTGLGHGATPDVVMNTNLFGPKRVIEGFMPLLSKSGRIVNVGSGAGPMYVARCSSDVKKMPLQPRYLLGADRRTCQVRTGLFSGRHGWLRLVESLVELLHHAAGQAAILSS